MAKFLSSYINNDRKAAIDSFLELTGEHWGTSIIQTVKAAAKLMDDQDVPITGRAVFQPGVGVLYDPAERVVSMMDENDQINKSFLFLIKSARSHSAFYILSKLRELNRELLAIINIEEGD
jgi:hypothetical protein